MGSAPAKKLGQMIGSVLQDAYYKHFEDFARANNLYLDSDGQERPGVRDGSELTWLDGSDVKRKVTYALETGGSKSKQGEPFAFVRANWRRDKKHSTQVAEAIVALLALGRRFKRNPPHNIAILAGEYSDSALLDLRANGFRAVVVVPSHVVIAAFADWNIDISGGDLRDDPFWNRQVEKIYGLSDAKRRSLVTRLYDDTADRFAPLFADLATTTEQPRTTRA
jgi:hypothetical protein